MGLTSIPGWTAISGGTIELWRALNGVNASDGFNFAELDYRTAFDGFQQVVQTSAGQTYTLTFDARLRPSTSASHPGDRGALERRARRPYHTRQHLEGLHPQSDWRRSAGHPCHPGARRAEQ